MSSFFNEQERQYLMQRLEKITADTKAQWGKMNASQMLKHLNNALHYPLGDTTAKMKHNFFSRTFFKPMAYKGKMFPKKSPTVDEFRVDPNAPANFDEEKKTLLDNLKRASTGPSAIKNHVHPFFGKLTPEQWGRHFYKHMNHHFTQFGK